jgi:hypothetical protein
MSEGDRIQLYISLLRGLARQCQDKLCAANDQHAWGEMVATDHWPDLPFVPLGDSISDMKITRSYRRECTNCGKVDQC